jgi:hypothetical protein
MLYEQIGNSCGAWCTAHREAIKNPALMAGADSFVNLAQGIYARVQFETTDGGTGWSASRAGAFTSWCTDNYANPWKIADHLARAGIGAQVSLEPAAAATAKVVPELGDMVFILENLATRGGRAISPRTLAAIPAGGYAIGVFQEGLLGLHYLLLHRGPQFRVYDPRSQQLNWRNLGGAPAFNGVVTTVLQNPGRPKMSFKFLGAFVSC